MSRVLGIVWVDRLFGRGFRRIEAVRAVVAAVFAAVASEEKVLACQAAVGVEYVVGRLLW